MEKDIYSNTYTPPPDYGPRPLVGNLRQATLQNTDFRRALWTGNHLQNTLMSIEPGGEIGLENHEGLDQFLRIEDGQGQVRMGAGRDRPDFQKDVGPGSAIFIPANTWHNLVNTGDKPIKLYSIYAPVQHPHGTVHKTKADADAAEHD